MKKPRTYLAAVWIRCTIGLSVVSVIASTACGSYIVRIGDPRFGGETSWTAALDSGLVRPLNVLSGPASGYYLSEATRHGMYGYRLAPSQLVPTDDGSVQPYTYHTEHYRGDESYEWDDDAGGGGETALVVSWPYTSFDFGSLTVAGWEFVYDADPNLRGAVSSLTFHTPPGIFSQGLEWIDVNGLSSGIFQEPGQQGVFQFISDPNFDITRVIKLQVTIAARNGQVLGEQDPTGNGDAWAAFGGLAVGPQAVPEPTSCLLLGSGMLVLLFGHGTARRTRFPSSSR